MQNTSPENLQFPENSLLADESFQSEWDFCYLESSETNTLNLALIYEYTRECPWIVDAVDQWLDIRFPEPNQLDYESGAEITSLPKFFIGKKIRDTLTILGKAKRSRFPENQLKAILGNIFESAPNHISGHSISGCFCFLAHWPRPFRTIYRSDCWSNYVELDNLFNKTENPDCSDPIFDRFPEARRLLIHKEKYGDALNEISLEKAQESYKMEDDKSRRIVTFEIDFNQPRQDLLETFRLWLQSNGHKGPKKTPDDFYKVRLKWLAAKRLKAFYREKEQILSTLLDDLQFIFTTEVEGKRKIHPLLPVCGGQTVLDKMVRQAKGFIKEDIAITRKTVMSQSEGQGIVLKSITEPWLK
jgi:hypothetical protein